MPSELSKDDADACCASSSSSTDVASASVGERGVLHVAPTDAATTEPKLFGVAYPAMYKALKAQLPEVFRAAIDIGRRCTGRQRFRLHRGRYGRR